MIKLILLLIISYLIGSISNAVIISKFLALPDPRTKGSQSAGATNILRLAGKKPALLVLIADALKGLIPVLFAWTLGIKGMALGFIVLAGVLGHTYPIFFQFKGGKGVATTLGGLLGINPLLAIFAVAVWGMVAKTFKFSSLASMSAMVATTLLSPILANKSYFLPLLLITLVILYQHRQNITRLLAGTEPKLGEKKSGLVK